MVIYLTQLCSNIVSIILIVIHKLCCIVFMVCGLCVQIHLYPTLYREQDNNIISIHLLYNIFILNTDVSVSSVETGPC